MARTDSRLFLAALAGAAIALTGATQAIGQVTVTEYRAGTTTAGAKLLGITAAPDGARGFAERNGNRIGRFLVGPLSEPTHAVRRRLHQSGIILGPEEVAVPASYWTLITTSPDSSIPMVKIDGQFHTFSWGGILLGSGEQRLGDHFCTDEPAGTRCDGIARLVGPTLETLRFNPFDSARGQPIAVYRRPPVGSADPRPFFSDMWPMGIYYNQAEGELLIFDGGDDRPAVSDGDPYTDSSRGWYGTGELLVSKDKGETFSRGGRILEPPVRKSVWAQEYPIYGVYGITHPVATRSLDGQYIYLYLSWQDKDESGLAVARSKIDGGRTGRPGTWFYYRNGAWDEPGLGGKPDILIPRINSFHVSWNTYLNQYVLIGTWWGVPLAERGYYFYTSPDGIKWTSHGMFWKVNNDFDMPGLPPAVMFPTLFSPDSDWDGITTRQMYLYYSYQPDSGNFTYRELRRRSLSIGRAVVGPLSESTHVVRRRLHRNRPPIPGQLTGYDRTGIPDAIPNSDRIDRAEWVYPASQAGKAPARYDLRMVRNNQPAPDHCAPRDNTLAGADVHPYTFASDGTLYTANNDPSGWMIAEGTHLEVLAITGDFDEFNPLPCDGYAGVSQAVSRGIGAPDPLGGFLTGDAWSYSNGITSVHGVLYMTHSGIYMDGETYNLDRPVDDPGRFRGIAYSTDHGQSWIEPGLPRGFAAGHAVSMYFVQEAQDSADSPRPFNTAPSETDERLRYIYAITHDREFAGSFLRLGRCRVPEPWDPAYIADLAHWEWFAGFEEGMPTTPRWNRDAKEAVSLPGVSSSEFLHQKIMYPSMAYDAKAGLYLLAMTKMNYAADDPVPWCAGHDGCSWRDGGGRVVIFEGAKPWGPFHFVAQDDEYSQTMKYSVQVLTKGQGSIDPATHRQQVWVTYTGAYGGCWSPECEKSTFDYGEYGTNFRKLVLTLR